MKDIDSYYYALLVPYVTWDATVASEDVIDDYGIGYWNWNWTNNWKTFKDDIKL